MTRDSPLKDKTALTTIGWLDEKHSTPFLFEFGVSGKEEDRTFLKTKK